MDEMIKDLHRDLARKLQRHGSRVEQMWRSLGQEQREKALKDGAREGDILAHSQDASLGNVYKIMPEWNLQDLTPSSSELLLDIL
jgi:rubrerythrin